MEVVGIDLIKLFRNFKFEKSAVILTGHNGDRRLLFLPTLTSKQIMFRSKSLLRRISLFAPGRKLSKSGLRSKKG